MVFLEQQESWNSGAFSIRESPALFHLIVQNSAGNKTGDMTFTCIYFLQHHCCSDAHSQDVGGVQQGFIFAGVVEWQAGMMESMKS